MMRAARTLADYLKSRGTPDADLPTLQRELTDRDSTLAQRRQVEARMAREVEYARMHGDAASVRRAEGNLFRHQLDTERLERQRAELDWMLRVAARALEVER